MTTIINASTSNGLVQTADGSGILKVQSNGKTTNALAWVNFVGTTGVIRSSYNVSSITTNASGDYTANFTNAMSDANYAAAGNPGDDPWYQDNYPICLVFKYYTTTSIRMINMRSVNATYYPAQYINVLIFGN